MEHTLAAFGILFIVIIVGIIITALGCWASDFFEKVKNFKKAEQIQFEYDRLLLVYEDQTNEVEALKEENKMLKMRTEYR